MPDKPKNFSQAIDDLEDTLKKIKPHLDDLGERVSASLHEHAGKAKERVEAEVDRNPWRTLGIAGLVFFLLGFLLGSRSRRSD